VIFSSLRTNFRKEDAERMSLFGNLVEVVLDHPTISGSAGAFIGCVFAALLGMTGLATLLFLAGVGLAAWHIYASTR
jgi:hypothetical protein